MSFATSTSAQRQVLPPDCPSSGPPESDIWALVRHLVDQEQRSRQYQEQLESRTRESQVAHHQLHIYSVQLERRAAALEQSLMLERNKVNELESRVSSLNSVSGALLQCMIQKNTQAQVPMNQPFALNGSGDAGAPEPAQQEAVLGPDLSSYCGCELHEDMQSESNLFSVGGSDIAAGC